MICDFAGSRRTLRERERERERERVSVLKKLLIFVGIMVLSVDGESAIDCWGSWTDIPEYKFQLDGSGCNSSSTTINNNESCDKITNYCRGSVYARCGCCDDDIQQAGNGNYIAHRYGKKSLCQGNEDYSDETDAVVSADYQLSGSVDNVIYKIKGSDSSPLWYYTCKDDYYSIPKGVLDTVVSGKAVGPEIPVNGCESSSTLETLHYTKSPYNYCYLSNSNGIDTDDDKINQRIATCYPKDGQELTVKLANANIYVNTVEQKWFWKCDSTHYRKNSKYDGECVKAQDCYDDGRGINEDDRVCDACTDGDYGNPNNNGVRKCSKGNVYSCASGYYGPVASSNSNSCTPCPYRNEYPDSVGSEFLNNSDITSCYITGSDKQMRDQRGTYTYTITNLTSSGDNTAKCTNGKCYWQPPQ